MSEIIQRLHEVDFDDLFRHAVTAAKDVILHGWDSVKEHVKKAAKNLRDAGVSIAKMLATGVISQEEARILLEDERLVVRMQLRTVLAGAILTAQRVVAAILGVFRDAFNRIMGFDLV